MKTPLAYVVTAADGSKFAQLGLLQTVSFGLKDQRVTLANALYVDTALRNHTAHQTNVRALVKMRFAVGDAHLLATLDGYETRFVKGIEVGTLKRVSQVIRDVLLAQQPNKRFATVEELGALTAFLCSDAASYMTGSSVLVDGGMVKCL